MCTPTGPFVGAVVSEQTPSQSQHKSLPPRSPTRGPNRCSLDNEAQRINRAFPVDPPFQRPTSWVGKDGPPVAQGGRLLCGTQWLDSMGGAGPTGAWVWAATTHRSPAGPTHSRGRAIRRAEGGSHPWQTDGRGGRVGDVRIGGNGRRGMIEE